MKDRLSSKKNNINYRDKCSEQVFKPKEESPNSNNFNNICSPKITKSIKNGLIYCLLSFVFVGTKGDFVNSYPKHTIKTTIDISDSDFSLMGGIDFSQRKNSRNFVAAIDNTGKTLWVKNIIDSSEDYSEIEEMEYIGGDDIVVLSKSNHNNKCFNLKKINLASNLISEDTDFMGAFCDEISSFRKFKDGRIGVATVSNNIQSHVLLLSPDTWELDFNQEIISEPEFNFKVKDTLVKATNNFCFAGDYQNIITDKTSAVFAGTDIGSKQYVMGPDAYFHPKVDLAFQEFVPGIFAGNPFFVTMGDSAGSFVRIRNKDQETTEYIRYFNDKYGLDAIDLSQKVGSGAVVSYTATSGFIDQQSLHKKVEFDESGNILAEIDAGPIDIDSKKNIYPTITDNVLGFWKNNDVSTLASYNINNELEDCIKKDKFLNKQNVNLNKISVNLTLGTSNIKMHKKKGAYIRYLSKVKGLTECSDNIEILKSAKYPTKIPSLSPTSKDSKNSFYIVAIGVGGTILGRVILGSLICFLLVCICILCRNRSRIRYTIPAYTDIEMQ